MIYVHSLRRQQRNLYKHHQFIPGCMKHKNQKYKQLLANNKIMTKLLAYNNKLSCSDNVIYKKSFVSII